MIAVDVHVDGIEAIGNSLLHGTETTQQHLAKGVCLGDRDTPPRDWGEVREGAGIDPQGRR